MTKDTILLAIADTHLRELVDEFLRSHGYAVLKVENATARGHLERADHGISVAVCDAPNADVLTGIGEMSQGVARPPLVLLTENGSSPSSPRATCLVKPFSANALLAAVRNSIGGGAPAAASVQQQAMICDSPRMRKIGALLDKIALSSVPVILRGESGTGKEVLARRLHACSPRASKPFIKINCAALPSELLESELFGYERGAFTGAFKTTVGKFELADGGSLLLDEIGDMDLKLQAKLLHVLQDSEFYRLGGKKAVQTDVRVIAATHRNLKRAVGQGFFREDLYYRLSVVDVEIPPLRHRHEEILPLIRFFIEKHAAPGQAKPAISPELERALLEHSWPGNVRELENVARRLLVFGDPTLIAEELTPARSDAKTVWDARHQSPPRSGLLVLEDIDRASRLTETGTILAALEQVKWNRRKAADMLQIDYKGLLYKMKKLGITKELRTSPPRLEDLATGMVV